MSQGVPLADAALLGTLPARIQEELVGAADPVRLQAREWLFREGDPADRLYLVVSGRLRVVVEHDGEERVARLLGPGAAIGELAILTGSPRSASVQAVRDSELLELRGDDFLARLGRDPELSVGLATSLARQLQESGGLAEPDARPAVFAVRPTAATEGRAFFGALHAAFAELGSTVTADRPHGDDWSTELAMLERGADYVLLFAPGDRGAWTDFCIRQADRVLVLTGGAPHEDLSVPAGSDVAFLSARAARTLPEWRAALHPRAHHVVAPDDRSAPHRVARRLTGRSLGLVLSGGGARALAHLGVLEVLAGEGLEIDRVGGTSMGAFISGMVALGWTPERAIETCRTEVAQRAPFSDYTVPRYALIRARRGESMLRRVFGDVTVEELSRPLFTVSADLVSGRMVVHREGPLVEAIGISMTIPGLAPPRPRGAQLLVDGGILNNLPIDVMVADETGPVVAVDVMRRVSAEGRRMPMRPSLPTILETLSRATVLASIERAEATRSLAHIVITPDIGELSLRDFRRIDPAIDAGRRAAEAALSAGAKAELAAALSSRPAAPAP
jgi:NTE family protein